MPSTRSSKDQRRLVRQRLRVLAKPVVEASINVIGVLDNVSQAIGQPLDEVRQLQADTLRWEAVADEARAFLRGVEGANLIRRQRLAVIAAQAPEPPTDRSGTSATSSKRTATHNGRSLEAFGRTGRLWKTDDIGCGGFRRMVLTEDDELHGEALHACQGQWGASP